MVPRVVGGSPLHVDGLCLAYMLQVTVRALAPTLHMKRTDLQFPVLFTRIGIKVVRVVCEPAFFGIVGIVCPMYLAV